MYSLQYRWLKKQYQRTKMDASAQENESNKIKEISKGVHCSPETPEFFETQSKALNTSPFGRQSKYITCSFFKCALTKY